MKEYGMHDGRVTVWIDEREALPVRAIPYVTSWQVSPDSIVRTLTRPSTIKVDTNLELRDRYALGAYRMDDLGRYEPLPASQWKNCAVSINSLTKKLKADEREEATDENYGPWRLAAIQVLPDNAFVWLDEFQAWYSTTRPTVHREGDSIRLSALRAGRERADSDAQHLDDLEADIFQTTDDSLCLAPILPTEIEGTLWRYAEVVVPVASGNEQTDTHHNASTSPKDNAGRTGQVWWSVARTEGEKWYAEKVKEKKKNDTPIQQKHIAAYVDQWLFDNGYRGRSGQRISRSSILEQISGIANRQKNGMGWK